MTITTDLGRYAKAAQYGSHILWERVSDYRATQPADVPVSADAITQQWLEPILCAGVPDAKIIDFECHGGSNGTSTRRALTVTYNGAGAAADLPTDLFAKGTPHLKNRLLLGPSGRSESEVQFYKNFRQLLPIEAPVALYAGYHRSSGRSCLIFHDLLKQGTSFLEPNYFIDRQKAEQMVSLVARYQAKLWNSPGIGGKEWFKTTLDYQKGLDNVIPFERCSMTGIKRSGHVLPSAILARTSEIWAAHMKSIELSVCAPLTLTHWDTHVGNWYLTSAGQMGLSDWSMRAGHWSCDLAYTLVSALTIDNRRLWEKELILLYIDTLKASGVSAPPSFSEAWLGYRRQAFHPLFYWLSTIGAGPLQPNMQPDEISLENIQRMGQAIVDLESFSAVQN